MYRHWLVGISSYDYIKLTKLGGYLYQCRNLQKVTLVVRKLSTGNSSSQYNKRLFNNKPGLS